CYSFLLLLTLFFILPYPIKTLTIPNLQPITNPSANGSLTLEPNVHCTRDETWKSPFFHDLPYYLQSCTWALNIMQADLLSYASHTEYEFIDRRAEPLTTKPTIRLPKIYNAREYNSFPQQSKSMLLLTQKSSARHTPSGQDRPFHLRSCTVAIAMVGSLAPGDALPGEPTGPFGLSEVMTPGMLLQKGLQPLRTCLYGQSYGDPAWMPALGWSQAGNSGPSTSLNAFC
ncbi:MAG: hypothetical protein Q9221_005611, partial [Calogaya cf. arnoldii]